MGDSADTAGMPDVQSRRAFFRFEIVYQDRPPEMKFESAPNFSHAEMRAARGPIFGMTFGHIVSLRILSPSSVAALRGLNSDTRNGVRFATSQHAREIMALGPPHSRAVFLCIRPNASSKGDGYMKDTDHPIRHPRIFGRDLGRRSCTSYRDQFGRGQNTGLGWSDPQFL
jgi:hypothetical protein